MAINAGCESGIIALFFGFGIRCLGRASPFEQLITPSRHSRTSSKHTSTRSSLAGFRKKCRLFVVASSLLLALANPSADAKCAVADPVRFSIDGTEYHVPAALQPFYAPTDALRTQDYFPQGVRERQYCQPASIPPAAVTTFSFRDKELAAWAARNPGFSRLAAIYPLALHRAPSTPPPEIREGYLTSNDLFRRVDRDGKRYELVSTRPLLFGAPVFAHCNLIATKPPIIRCRIWGRLPAGSLISVDTRDAQETWPEMLTQVERFITSLMH